MKIDSEYIQLYVEHMKQLIENDDPEIAHRAADAILCEVLEDIGAEELVKLFRKVPKWYA